MDLAELFTGISLCLCSAFLSGSEVALFSLSRFELRALKVHFPDAHRKIKELLSDPGGLLLSILFANEILNVSFATLIARIVVTHWIPIDTLVSPYLRPIFGNDTPTWAMELIVSSALVIPLVLLLCEITPKVLATRMNRLVAPRVAHALYWVYRVFLPIRWISRAFISIFSKNHNKRIEPTSDPQFFQEEDFMLLVEEGHRAGKIKRTELDLIRNLFELDDTLVGQIFTPLSEVYSFKQGALLKDVVHSIQGKIIPSRIPIFDSKLKKILGIVHTKDLLQVRLDPDLMHQPVEELMKKPLLVKKNTQLNTLFRRFKENKTRIAVVSDDQETTLGIVTMNDLLYELFEDLFPDSLDPLEKRG